MNDFDHDFRFIDKTNFTVTPMNSGRLCNQLFRNIIVSLIAEKSDIYVEYSSADKIQQLGIFLYVGKKYPTQKIQLTEGNFSKIFENPQTPYILITRRFFQTRPFITRIYEYLNRQSLKDSIIQKNPYKQRYKNNNDMFVHLRLGDVTGLTTQNPGLNFFTGCIKNIKHDKLFIGTNLDKNNKLLENNKHEWIRLLEKEYNAQVIELDEIETIQFASTCKHVVLSHGTYSAIIGYLSYFSEVYYFNSNPKWCPIDMLRIPHWHGI